MSIRSRLRAYRQLLLAGGLGSLCVVGMGTTWAAYSTVYTTDPSYTVTMSGVSNHSADTQWTDGGHVGRQATTTD